MTGIPTNVPVLINFFNRPEPLAKVFESVRKAKPAVLFLSQDGAREGNANDEKNVEKCRECVSNIDWDCKVYYNYSDKNLGCGRRMSSAITWAFSYVDRLIILEDDCVPSESFFPFCEELLEKYKDDHRISIISAMNHLEKYHDDDADYLFCNSGAIWGWATWKREWDLYDFEMKSLSEDDVIAKISRSSYPSYYKRDFIKQGRNRFALLKDGKNVSSWTFQLNILRFLNHQLTIVPTVNMISNVGLTSDSTHASSNIKQIPKGLQSIFFMKGYQLQFPLRHPAYTYCDDEFDRKVWKKLGMQAAVGVYRKCAGVIRQLFFGGRKKVLKKAFRGCKH